MFGLNGSVLCDQQLPFVTIIEVRKPFYSVLQLKMRRDGGGIGRKGITCDEWHTQLLCRLLMCSACETHEGDARVGPGSTAIEYFCYTDDGTGEVDVACGLSIYSTVWLDLDSQGNEVS